MLLGSAGNDLIWGAEGGYILCGRDGNGTLIESAMLNGVEPTHRTFTVGIAFCTKKRIPMPGQQKPGGGRLAPRSGCEGRQHGRPNDQP